MYSPSGVLPIPLHIGHFPSFFNCSRFLASCFSLLWCTVLGLPIKSTWLSSLTPKRVSIVSLATVAHDVNKQHVRQTNIPLILKRTIFTYDSQALLAFLDATYDLGIDIETLADGDDLFGNLGTDIDFHTVPHIEHLVHLLPVGA